MYRCQKLKIDNTIKVAGTISDFLMPNYIYVPVVAHSQIYIKNKDYVTKNQVLITTKEKTIMAPVSGQIVGTSLITIENNKQVKSIIIENDFKEKIIRKKAACKDISSLTKEQIITNLTNYELVECRSNNLLAKKLTKMPKISHLLINGIENEPYIANKQIILQNKDNELLDAIISLMNGFQIPQATIMLKTNDALNINKYSNLLGMYPEITLTLVADLYPSGDYKILESIMVNKNILANELLILDIEDIWYCYNILKKNRYLTEKIITVTGNAVASPKVINVKLGTSVREILSDFKILSNNVEYFADGLLRGNIIFNINNYIVTERTRAIIVNQRLDDKSGECLNCGKCNAVCPVGIDPRSKEKDLRCLKCNLCAYYCPAHIKIRNKGDNNEA